MTPRSAAWKKSWPLYDMATEIIVIAILAACIVAMVARGENERMPAPTTRPERHKNHRRETPPPPDPVACRHAVLAQRHFDIGAFGWQAAEGVRAKNAV